MTTDAQRTIVREYLAERFGSAFNVAVSARDGFDDEAHVAFPILTPAGRRVVQHYRYASSATFFRFDGRKTLHPDQLNALYVDLYNDLHKGAHDPRNTSQSRDDYQAALDAAL